MRKRVKGWRRPSAISLLRLWGAARSSGRKPEDSIPVQTALSNVQTKSLKDILGNHSIIWKCRLIYVRDLLSFTSHWLFVSYVQIPWTIKTIHIPLLVWHFQSYKEESYELLKRENQFWWSSGICDWIQFRTMYQLLEFRRLGVVIYSSCCRLR